MKKILFVMLMLAPMSIFAQKFAHFNMADVLPEMAEYKAASADIQKLTTQYQEELEQILYFYEHPPVIDEKFKADVDQIRNFFN